RYGATRFPGKLMQLLENKTVILRTYESTLNTQLFDDVVVVCDSDIIYEEITKHGGRAIKSQKEHNCGTDRIAEAAHQLDEFEIIVNVQGDEPFTSKEPLEKLLQVFEGEEGQSIRVASLM